MKIDLPNFNGHLNIEFLVEVMFFEYMKIQEGKQEEVATHKLKGGASIC